MKEFMRMMMLKLSDCVTDTIEKAINTRGPMREFIRLMMLQVRDFVVFEGPPVAKTTALDQNGTCRSK